MISLLLTGGSLWSFVSQASVLKPPLPLELPDQTTQLPPHYLISSSQIFTYYSYLPLVSKPSFDLVSFPATGPAYAVPAIDDRSIYIGSGFDNDCRNTGEIRAFDKASLALVWKTAVNGAIGDTSLTLVDNKVIFGAGDGVAAIRTSDGRLVWQRHLKGCFQESFIRLYQNRIYMGSSTGHIYSITPQGQVLWQNRLPGTVFAAPAVFGNTLYFVDMTNTLSAVNVATGQIGWQKQLPLEPGDQAGIFASPLFYDNSLLIATYSHDVWRVSLTGQVEARYSGSDRYVASPIVCDGSIVVANLTGQVDWLAAANLQPRANVIITGSLLFGTPQCYNKIIVVTVYGSEDKASVLYYLEFGQVLKQVEFPCCKHALTTTTVDTMSVYNVLTSTDQADLIRSRFAPGK